MSSTILTAPISLRAGFSASITLWSGAAPAAKKLGAKEQRTRRLPRSSSSWASIRRPLDPMVQQLRDAIGRDGHLKATIEKHQRRAGRCTNSPFAWKVAKAAGERITPTVLGGAGRGPEKTRLCKQKKQEGRRSLLNRGTTNERKRNAVAGGAVDRPRSGRRGHHRFIRGSTKPLLEYNVAIGKLKDTIEQKKTAPAR